MSAHYQTKVVNLYWQLLTLLFH